MPRSSTRGEHLLELTLHMFSCFRLQLQSSFAFTLSDARLTVVPSRWRRQRGARDRAEERSGGGSRQAVVGSGKQGRWWRRTRGGAPTLRAARRAFPDSARIETDQITRPAGIGNPGGLVGAVSCRLVVSSWCCTFILWEKKILTSNSNEKRLCLCTIFFVAYPSRATPIALVRVIQWIFSSYIINVFNGLSNICSLYFNSLPSTFYISWKNYHILYLERHGASSKMKSEKGGLETRKKMEGGVESIGIWYFGFFKILLFISDTITECKDISWKNKRLALWK